MRFRASRRTRFTSIRVRWFISTIILIAFCGIVYGLTHLGSMTLRVIPERQPLFVTMSDGSIQNKYDFKVLNKTDKDLHVKVTAEGGVAGQVIIGAEEPAVDSSWPRHLVHDLRQGARANVKEEVTPIEFRVEAVEDPTVTAEYDQQIQRSKTLTRRA